jgi:hypothetical protein
VAFLSLTVVTCGSDPTGVDRIDSVTLAWNAPTTSVDGTQLTDLAGYRILYGPSSPLTPANATTIDVGNVTTYTVRGLQAGTVYFTVLALDRRGNLGPVSADISTEIPAR